MTEEVSFHNSFVKQIKAWINEAKNKGNKRKTSTTRLFGGYPSEDRRENSLNACLIPRYICDALINQPDKMRQLLKTSQHSAIMIAESYSRIEKRKMPESLRNKIMMFKL